jgi:hypothetical protein
MNMYKKLTFTKLSTSNSVLRRATVHTLTASPIYFFLMNYVELSTI